MSDHTADLLALQHWRARAAELEHERDQAQTAARGLAQCCEVARGERDEARALLRECRDYIRDERQPHPNSPVGQLLARLDALLGGDR